MKKSLTISLISILFLVILTGVYFYYPTTKITENKTSVCIKAGEVYQSPSGLGPKRGECCPGLIDIAQMAPTDCDASGNSNLGGGNSICSACGNGICESWENKCNCIRDCPVASNASCHAEGIFWSPMPHQDGTQNTRPCCPGLTEVGNLIATDTGLCINCGDKICKNYTFASETISEKTLCPSDCK